MRSRALAYPVRIACMFATALPLAFAPIGCGENSGNTTETVKQLPPEVEKANKSMEDFMKTKSAAKKK